MQRALLKNLVPFFLIIAILTGCSSSDDRVFEINNELDFVIPGGLNQFETHFFPVNDVPTLWNAYLENSGFVEEQIGEILPVRASIESKFGENLDYINRVSVWMYDISGNNGREVFFMDPVQLGSKTEIELFSNLTNVTELLKQQRVLIELRLTLRNVSAISTDLRLRLNFAVFPIE